MKESSRPSELEQKELKSVLLQIDETTVPIRFADNETAMALQKRLPLTMQMKELNGNEKYHYVPFSLPTNPKYIGTVQAGDLMLYGSDCLVLFYESFQTDIQYTRIGWVEPNRLSELLSADTVRVQMSTEQ
ncbi:cyclophilin-like fold protein [Exiguobacterium acetylicum]|uniref:cyclophilin-like fold protein n=1 Tax=Exiguobacterium TaxID=33986 RepID=UPI0025C08746|nr:MULTISPECIES: cyclophilin-like fold protein [Exiguobacterium]MDQ6466370.1 cyclophilin-like fold protein [Exiguobacterium acetylicum]